MDKKLILAVAFDEENNVYSVDIPAGSSVQETCFAMAIVAKCLVRDKVVDDADVIIDLIKKYCTDEQYQEVT